jgi:hypothetical protein
MIWIYAGHGSACRERLSEPNPHLAGVDRSPAFHIRFDVKQNASVLPACEPYPDDCQTHGGRYWHRIPITGAASSSSTVHPRARK